MFVIVEISEHSQINVVLHTDLSLFASATGRGSEVVSACVTVGIFSRRHHCQTHTSGSFPEKRTTSNVNWINKPWTFLRCVKHSLCFFRKSNHLIGSPCTHTRRPPTASSVWSETRLFMFDALQWDLCFTWLLVSLFCVLLSRFLPVLQLTPSVCFCSSQYETFSQSPSMWSCMLILKEPWALTFVSQHASSYRHVICYHVSKIKVLLERLTSVWNRQCR